MKCLRILCVLCVLSVEAFGLDRTAFTFLKYSLEVRVDPSSQAMAARGTVLLRNDSASPQSDLAMQVSSSLEWRLIHINGKDVQYSTNDYPSDIDHSGKLSEVIVQLPAPVAPHATIEVEVGYSGEITRDAARLTAIGVPSTTAAHTDWDRIGEPVSAVRGIGYVAWYPVEVQAVHISDSEYSDVLASWKEREQGSSMKLALCWISDEHELSAVSNGEFEGLNRQLLGATEDTATHSGCSQFSYANLGTTVPTFAVGEYSTLSRPVIDTYYLADQQSFAQEYALAAEKVLPLDTQWFGAPKRKVIVVQLPDLDDAAYESDTMLVTPLSTTDVKLLQERMMHQLVHASFPSPRPWIEEGLAHFGTALLRAEQGRASAIDYMDQFLPALQAAEKNAGSAVPPAPAGTSSSKPAEASAQDPSEAERSLINSPDEIMFRIKSMFVWWMLREMVGDAPLQKALAAYRPAEDKSATYLPDLISHEAHRDLSWFFDDWVYRDRGLADFQVVSAFPRKTLAHSWVVAVTVEDQGSAGAEVPVIIRTAQGDRSRRVLVKAHDKSVERIEVPDLPTEVIVNDGSVPESDTSNNTFKIQAAPPQ